MGYDAHSSTRGQKSILFALTYPHHHLSKTSWFLVILACIKCQNISKNVRQNADSWTYFSTGTSTVKRTSSVLLLETGTKLLSLSLSLSERSCSLICDLIDEVYSWDLAQEVSVWSTNFRTWAVFRGSLDLDIAYNVVDEVCPWFRICVNYIREFATWIHKYTN